LWAAKSSVARLTDAEIAGLQGLLSDFNTLFEGDTRKDLMIFASANRDFHTYLVSLAHNERLLDIYGGLNIDVIGSRIYRMGATLRSAAVVHAEHEAIVRACAARDPEAAAQAITRHLITARDVHLAAFTEDDGPR
jgi:DNA-binding GntR family transcriptional regulator